jgi:hypothetical protein
MKSLMLVQQERVGGSHSQREMKLKALLERRYQSVLIPFIQSHVVIIISIMKLIFGSEKKTKRGTTEQ